MNCARFNVGDKGQRYAVVANDRTSGRQITLGWTETNDGRMEKAFRGWSKIVSGSVKLLDRRGDGPDAEGVCKRCGLLWDDGEPHLCPEGF